MFFLGGGFPVYDTQRKGEREAENEVCEVINCAMDLCVQNFA